MFTNKPGFEFTRVGPSFDDGGFDDGGSDDAVFDARRADFTRQLELPPERDIGGLAMRGACAGHNYDTGGSVSAVSAASLAVQDAVDAHLRRDLAALSADTDRWNWVRCKLMLHQLETASPFEALC
jgi:hypothetical protein